MAQLRTLTFTRPSLIRVATPAVLARLLEPHSEFLATEDFSIIDYVEAEDCLPFTIKLIAIVTESGPQMPQELIEALFVVSELSTSAAREDVAAACVRLGFDLPATTSAEDQAIHLWCASKKIARQLYVERLPTKTRAFETYLAQTYKRTRTIDTSPEAYAAIRDSMERFFVKHKHTSGLSLYAYPRGNDEIWFLIRRGGKFRNVAATTESGESNVVGLFPEDFDIVVVNTKHEELRVHASGARAKAKYRETFGFFLFGRDSHFEEVACYDLTPLRTHGPASLISSDCEEIRLVKLVELTLLLPSGKNEYSAPDVFEHMDRQNLRIEAHHRLVGATFQFRFRDDPKLRRVILKAGNVANYERDEDSPVIDEWLKLRGFLSDQFNSTNFQHALLLGAA